MILNTFGTANVGANYLPNGYLNPWRGAFVLLHMFNSKYLLTSTTLRNLGINGGASTIVGSPTVDVAGMTINTAGTDYVQSTLTDNGGDYTLYTIVANLDNYISGNEPFVITNNSTGGNGHGVGLLLNGQGTANTLLTISRTSNLVTLTYSAATALIVAGNQVVISGVTTDTTLNGSFLVASASAGGGTVTMTYYCPGSNVSITGQGVAVPPSVSTLSQNYVNIAGSTTLEKANFIGPGGNTARFLASTYTTATGVLTVQDLTNGLSATNTNANPRVLMPGFFCFGGNPLSNGGKIRLWMGGLAQAVHTSAQINANYSWWKNLMANQAVASITISGNTMTVAPPSQGTLAVGQFVIGAQTGTQIMQQLTGTTGGAGTYLVNISQTIASFLTVSFGQII